MAHEELKKQWKEDVKQYGKDAYKLWEFRLLTDEWLTCCYPGPDWYKLTEYRRKKPSFQPEYFSGLNWRDALPLVGKVVEFSQDGSIWTAPDTLNKILTNPPNLTCKYKRKTPEDRFIYIRTTPETHDHSTITLTVNGREWVLPMPETEVPQCGQTVYIWELTEIIGGVEWRGHMADREWLSNGQVFKKHKYAQAWADFWQEAILGAVRG